MGRYSSYRYIGIGIVAMGRYSSCTILEHMGRYSTIPFLFLDGFWPSRKRKAYINCPCNTPSGTLPPLYVGSSYYCESGSLKLIIMNPPIGTPVIPCGMVCSVEELRDLVVTTLDCPGLTKTHPLQLLVSAYSVWKRTQALQ